MTIPQQMDDAMAIYMQIINDTMDRSAGLQNRAVLEQVKQKWIANLKERIVQETTSSCSATPIQMKKEPKADRVGNVSNAMRGCKIRVLSDQTPVKVVPPDVAAEDQKSRTKDRHVKIKSEFDSTRLLVNEPENEIRSEEKDAGEGEGEDWGEWEDVDEQITVAPIATETDDGQSKIEEPQDNCYPSEADFSTRITTQYGRTEGLGRVVGEKSSSVNALNWVNPDEVDSDLDTVSDLSDEEPEARDTAIGQLDMIIRPGTKKVSSVGIWKIRLRNGIAKVYDAASLITRRRSMAKNFSSILYMWKLGSELAACTLMGLAAGCVTE